MSLPSARQAAETVVATLLKQPTAALSSPLEDEPSAATSPAVAVPVPPPLLPAAVAVPPPPAALGEGPDEDPAPVSDTGNSPSIGSITTNQRRARGSGASMLSAPAAELPTDPDPTAAHEVSLKPFRA